MQKTRLGISVGLIGSAMFFMGLFSGYFVVTLLAGYVLLFEQNAWLRRSAVKALSLMVFFSLLVTLLNLIPDVCDVVNNFAFIFNGNFSITVLDRFFNALVSGVNVIEKVLFMGLGLKALSQGTIVIPMIDKFISKHMG
ncbi:MAG: hypothetical protein MR936_03630 [Eubacterium sp.]|nr:hypothetical protein [Eubacterium sp.]